MDLRAGALSRERRRGEQAAKAVTVSTTGCSSLVGAAAGLFGKPADRPLLVAVGASFTAGVGAGRRSSSWAYLVAQRLGWRVDALGVPGAGYVRAGWHHGGPLSKEVAALDLPRLHPSVVVLQAGHNDVGVPLGRLYRHVYDLVHRIHTEVPKSRIALITVFLGGGRKPTRSDQLTNATIAIAAARADSKVFVMDPLTGHWQFPRVADNLHPDPAGYRWIAHRVTQRLRADGVRPDRPEHRNQRRSVAADRRTHCRTVPPAEHSTRFAQAA